MNTDIAGDLGEEEFNLKLAEARKVFYGSRVMGMYCGVRAKRDISVFEHGRIYDGRNCTGRGNHNIAVIRTEVPESFIEHAPEECKEHLRRDAEITGGTLLTTDLVFLMPYHKTALVVDKTCFDRYFKNGRQLLENLGYAVIEKDKWKSSSNWGLENKLGLLRNQRLPETNISAVDQRVNDILETLITELNLKTETLTFVTYIAKTKHRRNFESDNYGSLKINETDPTPKEENLQATRYLKEFITTPAQWAYSCLEKICKGLPLSRAVAISSRVETADGIKHIPMLDFESKDAYSYRRVKTGTDVDWFMDVNYKAHNCFWERPIPNIDEIEKYVQTLNIPGMLVNSGQSCHWYGFKLLDGNEWKSFTESLKKTSRLDTHPICKYWPNFQLAKGFSLLRLTPAIGKLYQPCLITPKTSRKSEGDSCFSARTIPHDGKAVA